MRLGRRAGEPNPEAPGTGCPQQVPAQCCALVFEEDKLSGFAVSSPLYLEDLYGYCWFFVTCSAGYMWCPVSRFWVVSLKALLW